METADVAGFRAAVQHLLNAARRERSMLPLGSSARRFLLGVDAAALEVLYPELAQARREGWLDAETPEFRDGYLRTRTGITGALGRGDGPVTIPIPYPDPRIER